MQFALAGLLATIAIGLIAVAVISRAGTQGGDPRRQAGHAPGRRGHRRSGGHAAPCCAVTRRRCSAWTGWCEPACSRDGVVRVKLWSRRRAHRLLRRAAADRRALRAGRGGPSGPGGRPRRGRDQRPVARPENRFERGYGRAAGGLPAASMTRQGSRCCSRPTCASARSRRAGDGSGWPSRRPSSAASCSCSWSTCPWRDRWSRRLRRSQHEREALLHRALDASHAERRLIAADLHDGVVQDLLAAVLQLCAAHAERLDDSGGRRGRRRAARRRIDHPRGRPRAADAARRHLSAEPAPCGPRRGAARPGAHLHRARACRRRSTCRRTCR